MDVELAAMEERAFSEENVTDPSDRLTFLFMVDWCIGIYVAVYSCVSFPSCDYV